MLNSDRYIRCVLNIGTHPFMRNMTWNATEQNFVYVYTHKLDEVVRNINVQIYEIVETDTGHDIIPRAAIPDGVIKPVGLNSVVLVKYKPGSDGDGSNNEPIAPALELTFDPDDLLKDLARDP